MPLVALGQVEQKQQLGVRDWLWLTCCVLAQCWMCHCHWHCLAQLKLRCCNKHLYTAMFV